MLLNEIISSLYFTNFENPQVLGTLLPGLIIVSVKLNLPDSLYDFSFQQILFFISTMESEGRTFVIGPSKGHCNVY